MSEFTPDTEHVRAKYSRGMRSDGTPAVFEKWANEFDRWLAAHEARVRAEALRAFAKDTAYEAGMTLPDDEGSWASGAVWAAKRARDRADRIEQGVSS